MRLQTQPLGGAERHGLQIEQAEPGPGDLTVGLDQPPIVGRGGLAVSEGLVATGALQQADAG
jgi:hypothetical protein